MWRKAYRVAAGLIALSTLSACTLIPLVDRTPEQAVTESPASEPTPPSSPSPTQSTPQVTATVSAPDPAAAADQAAGVLSREIPNKGSGAFIRVPAAGLAVPAGVELRKTVAFEVEKGLPVNGVQFAKHALTSLNDGRGWGEGAWGFRPVDGEAQITVRLASPATSAAQCLPLDTGGKLSCARGSRAILTWYRWVEGHRDYRGDVTAYRHYVVNHEVGHVLGHDHRPCPRSGALAPIMQQQTKGVAPCRPNPWPHPNE